MGRVQIHVPGGKPPTRPPTTPLAALALAPILALTLALALAGCGSTTTTTTKASTPTPPASTPTPPTPPTPATPPTSSPPPEQEKETGHTKPPPAASIILTIPGLAGEHTIPTANTCDGANTPLPIQWTTVPPHTAELALFLLNLRPSTNKSLFIDWAVTGIKPTTHSIPPGKLPPGAIVGHNSYGTNGYSICPAKGVRETYVARLIALPHPLPAKPGFNAQTYYQNAENISKNIGLNGGTYTRP